MQQILLGGFALTTIGTAAIAILTGSCMLSYSVFMGDDRWEGRFPGAGACYVMGSFFLTGLGWSGLAAIVSYFVA